MSGVSRRRRGGIVRHDDDDVVVCVCRVGFLKVCGSRDCEDDRCSFGDGSFLFLSRVGLNCM